MIFEIVVVSESTATLLQNVSVPSTLIDDRTSVGGYTVNINTFEKPLSDVVISLLKALPFGELVLFSVTGSVGVGLENLRPKLLEHGYYMPNIKYPSILWKLGVECGVWLY